MELNIEQHKRGNSGQDIQVSMIVKEIAHYKVRDLQDFKEKFDKEVDAIPATNSYKASHFYKAIETEDANTLEVWKMKANSEPNYKMFTVSMK